MSELRSLPRSTLRLQVYRKRRNDEITLYLNPAQRTILREWVKGFTAIPYVSPQELENITRLNPIIKNGTLGKLVDWFGARLLSDLIDWEFVIQEKYSC